jgi:hypothetical protein
MYQIYPKYLNRTESNSNFQLCERAKTDLEFAALLARGPVEALDPGLPKKRSNSGSDSDEGSAKKPSQVSIR